MLDSAPLVCVPLCGLYARGGDSWSGFAEREEVFAAPCCLYKHTGEGTVVRTFGDPEPLSEAWELELPAFKEALRERMREALRAEKGAA